MRSIVCLPVFLSLLGFSSVAEAQARDALERSRAIRATSRAPEPAPPASFTIPEHFSMGMDGIQWGAGPVLRAPVSPSVSPAGTGEETPSVYIRCGNVNVTAVSAGNAGILAPGDTTVENCNLDIRMQQFDLPAGRRVRTGTCTERVTVNGREKLKAVSCRW